MDNSTYNDVIDRKKLRPANYIKSAEREGVLLGVSFN
jgi:hypothetical protein